MMNNSPTLSKLKNKLKIAGIIIAVIVLAISALITYYPNSPVTWTNIMQSLGGKQIFGTEDKMIFMDAGQSDCTVIISNGEVAVIDTGDALDGGKNVVSNLKKLGVTNIKYVVATHYHTDHIGGVKAITENFDVENIVLNEQYSYTDVSLDVINELLGAIDNNKINRINSKTGLTLYVGDFSLNLITAYDVNSDENENCTVIEAECNSVRTWLMADAGNEMLNLFNTMHYQWHYDTSCDILKVAHHGAKDSTSYEFLKITSPNQAVISCGKDNYYGHPSGELLDMLKELSINTYRTDTMGNITVIITDAYTYNITAQNSK